MNQHQGKDKDKDKLQASTLAALLKEKPKRGRPRHSISRQNVYVSLTRKQKKEMNRLPQLLPEAITRADIPDLAITILTARLDALHRAVADRNRAIPEGITDFESLYLLWDLELPQTDEPPKWTSIRLSPQQSVELGRAHGTFNAAFGTNRSQTFSLALALLAQYLEDFSVTQNLDSLEAIRRHIQRSFL